MRRFIFILVIGCVSSGIALSQAQNPDRMTVALSDPSRPGLLKINLINGGITVRIHSGRDVIIESQSTGRSRPSVIADGLRRIDVVGDGLTVVEEKNVVTVSAGTRNPGNLEIQVPVKTNLNLSTINGKALVIEGVDGDIEVSNTNGAVQLTDVSGSVVAHSNNGNLTVNLREIVANKAMSFTSMNGNVDITLPATAKANLRIRTDNGSAWTDFDLQNSQISPPTVEDTRSRGGQFRIVTGRTVTATINGGGDDVDVRTLNGNLYIRKAK